MLWLINIAVLFENLTNNQETKVGVKWYANSVFTTL